MVVPDGSHLISYGSPGPFSSSNPTGLFALLQLCRHMPPSRSLTFLFPLPGILSLPLPPLLTVTHVQPYQHHLPLTVPHTLFISLSGFLPRPLLCAYLVCQGTLCCLPLPQRMWAPHGMEFLHVVPSLNPP